MQGMVQTVRGRAFKLRPEGSSGQLKESEEEENSKQKDYPSEGPESKKSFFVPCSGRRERLAGARC